MLPVPTLQNEQLKGKRAKKENQENVQGDEIFTMDVELLSISENTPEVSLFTFKNLARCYGSHLSANASQASNDTMAVYLNCFEFTMEQYQIYMLWSHLFYVEGRCQ